MQEVDQLVRRVRGGEIETFAEIVRLYEQPVWRVVAAMLHSIDESHEIMQQVFVNVYTKLDQYELGRDFGAWIKTIARNCVRKELRRLSRESTRLTVYRERLEQRLRDEAEADRHESAFLEALEKCRGQLPKRSAEALRLRYTEGKPFDQIAELMATTSAAAEKLLSRVRIALRDCIQIRLAET